MSKINNFPC